MIGAIITVGGSRQADGSSFTHSPEEDLPLAGSPFSLWSLAGETILNRFLDQIRLRGIERICVVPEQPSKMTASVRPWINLRQSAVSGFWSRWEDSVQEYVSQGMETLLFARLGSYAEVDFDNLVHYHFQTSSTFTQVFSNHGALDLVLVQTAGLRKAAGSFRSRSANMALQRRRYRFVGYTNALATVEDFRKLTRDALSARCRVRPLGDEIRPKVWTGKDAVIDDSARIEGPAFIGEGSRINAACTVSKSSVIEQGCQIDSGTQISDSNILPHTYVGPGLNVLRSVVRESRLFNLGRNVELRIQDSRMLGAARHSRSLATRLKSAVLSSYGNLCVPGLSTSLRQAASLTTSSGTGRWHAPPLANVPESLSVQPQEDRWENPSQ